MEASPWAFCIESIGLEAKDIRLPDLLGGKRMNSYRFDSFINLTTESVCGDGVRPKNICRILNDGLMIYKTKVLR